MISLYSDSGPGEARSNKSRYNQSQSPRSPFEIRSNEADGERLAARYQMLEELGSGSFGVVYKAIEKSTGEVVAIKHVDLESSEEDLADIFSELSVLSSCSSPHVTKYRLAFLRRQTLWIVMEYLGGGSCADLLKPPPHSLTENHIAIIARELLLGLTYLHSEGKLHRDIKAANILLGTDGRVKLADFGVSAQLTGLKSVRNTFVGTPFWMAPEVIQQEGHDAKADIWSLGITAMELANGEPPHANVHPMKVLFLIPKQSAPRLEEGRWSKDFRDFVATCLTKDPDRRPSAKELLKHRFVKSAGKVEGLQELILRRQEWESAKIGEKSLKYYAETLKNLSSVQQDDDWVFETVKAGPVRDWRDVETQRLKGHDEVGIIDDEMISSNIMELNLNGKPNKAPSRQTSTMRKVSAPRQQESDSPSVRRATKKRSPSTQIRPPLGVNLSFGNSPSTVRQFRRVSPNAANDDAENEDPTGSVIRTPQKAKPALHPFADSEYNPSAMASRDLMSNPSRNPSTTSTVSVESKEAALGRRLYSQAIGMSCQEVLNETGDEVKREAIARLAEAFSDLESMDPEGMYHIMSSVVTRMKSDNKLRDMLPQPSPPSSTTPSNAVIGDSNPNTPTKSPAKLILAQNNPHLKSHRRRQSAQITKSRDSSQMWSPRSDDPDKEMMKNLNGGLEHTRQLADVLFGRWCEGLQVRWPAV